MQDDPVQLLHVEVRKPEQRGKGLALSVGQGRHSRGFQDTTTLLSYCPQLLASAPWVRSPRGQSNVLLGKALPPGSRIPTGEAHSFAAQIWRDPHASVSTESPEDLDKQPSPLPREAASIPHLTAVSPHLPRSRA